MDDWKKQKPLYHLVSSVCTSQNQSNSGTWLYAKVVVSVAHSGILIECGSLNIFTLSGCMWSICVARRSHGGPFNLLDF